MDKILRCLVAGVCFMECSIAPEVEDTTHKADYFSEEGISFTPSTDDPGFIVSGQKPHIGFKEVVQLA